MLRPHQETIPPLSGLTSFQCLELLHMHKTEVKTNHTKRKGINLLVEQQGVKIHSLLRWLLGSSLLLKAKGRKPN